MLYCAAGFPMTYLTIKYFLMKFLLIFYKNYKCFFRGVLKKLLSSYLVYLEFMLLLNVKILQPSLSKTSIIKHTLSHQIIP